jgi:AcrR family transcriptional regulator
MVQNNRSERRRRGTATRTRIIDATVRTLAEEGFVATSARAIARSGGFAPSVIYYHFDDRDDLLLAALDRTSETRLARYRQELESVTGAAELLGRLRALYSEDLAQGHIAAVQELVAGAASSPCLGRAIVERIGPWLDLTGEVARRLLAGTVLENLVTTQELSFAVLALYLGTETLAHLDRDRSRAEALFAAVEPAAAMFDTLVRRR